MAEGCGPAPLSAAGFQGLSQKVGPAAPLGTLLRGCCPHPGPWYYRWVVRSRLKPIRRVALMIRAHLENILPYLTHRSTHALTMEGRRSAFRCIVLRSNRKRRYSTHECGSPAVCEAGLCDAVLSFHTCVLESWLVQLGIRLIRNNRTSDLSTGTSCVHLGLQARHVLAHRNYSGPCRQP